jgi:streptogramin lyase
MRVKNGVASALSIVLFLFARTASAQFIYVANAGEDTLSKIDINTNTEVARYRTWFGPAGQPGNIVHPSITTSYGTLSFSPWAGPAPSRVAIDASGNVYVLNRFFYAPNIFSAPLNLPFPSTHLPVLLKILPSGGIPGVTTSNSSVALPMSDTNGDNQINCPLSASPACHAGPNEITDARIAWAVEVGDPGTSTTLGDRGSLGRSLCVDRSGNLWVGMYHTSKYYKVSSVTGQTIGGPISTGNHHPYSCVVDIKGTLWSVDEAQTLLEFDTTAANPTPLVHTHTGTNYSVSVVNSCTAASRVYVPEHAALQTSIAYDPSSGNFSNPSGNVPKFNSIALGIDSQSNIVSGEYLGNGRVIKYSPGSVLSWDTNTLPAGPTVTAKDLHGIIIDAHDDVWAVHLDGDRLIKYSGADGHKIATVPVGAAPYSYSNVPPPSCPCAGINGSEIVCTVKNGNTATYSWTFNFVNQSPFAAPVTGMTLSSTQVQNLTPSSIQFSPPIAQNAQGSASGTFTVTNPQPGATVCLTARLTSGDEWCCPSQQVCFRLPECRECAKLTGEFFCQKGTWALALSIVNNGPAAAQSVQIFSTTPGVTVSPTLTTMNFPVGTAVAVPLTISGASPGQPITLTVNVHGPVDPKSGVYSWCCTSAVTVVYPKTTCKKIVKTE